MADKLPPGTVIFNGHGQAGNWSDPTNWTGGVAPSGIASIGLFTMNATLNNTFTVGEMMMLGVEAITVNGTLNTLSTNHCQSFMICNGAVVTFSPTAVLNDAGGLLVGVDETGTFVAQGSGTAHAVLNSVDGKMGLNAGSSGSITIDDAIWHDSQRVFVGLAGHGSLSITNGGQVTTGDCFDLGSAVGGVGQASMSNGSQLNVATYALIGGAASATGGGTGTMSISSGSTMTVAQSLAIGSGSALTLSGGTLKVTNPYPGVKICAGGTLSGNGVVSVAAGSGAYGVTDSGMLQASGGTLTINGPLTGTGQVQIAGGATLAINAMSIGVPSIAFAGSNGTLALSHGIADHAVISGFAAGDSILMAGVDSISWNGSTDVLTLSSASHVVDTLQFAGTYGSNAFALTQGSAGAVIGLAPVHTGIIIGH